MAEPDATLLTGDPVAGPALALCKATMDGGEVLVAGTVDGRIVVHSLANAAVDAAWDASEGRILSVSTATRDGSVAIASVSETGEVAMWAFDGTELDRWQLPNHDRPSIAAATLQLGGGWPLVAHTDGHDVRLQMHGNPNARNMNAPEHVDDADEVTSLSFLAPNSLVVGYASGVVIVHGIEAGGPSIRTTPKPQSPLRAVALDSTSAGTRLATGAQRGEVAITDDSGRTIDLPHLHTDWIRALLWTDLGGARVLVSASDDGMIRVWNESANSVTIARHTASIRALTTTTTGSGRPVVVSGGTDGALRFWDVGAGEQIRHVPAAHDAWIDSVATMSDGSVVSGGRDRLRFWSRSGEPAGLTPVQGRPRAVAPLTGLPNPTAAIAFQGGGISSCTPGGLAEHRLTTPGGLLALGTSGQRIAAGGRRGVTVWKGLTDPESPSHFVESATVRSLQFNTKAGQPPRVDLAAVDTSGTLHRWGFAGDVVVPSPPMNVSAEPLWAVTYLPSVDSIACGGDDRVVHVVNSRNDATSLPRQTGRLRALTTVTRRGVELLVSGGTDGTIRTWDAATGQPVDRWPRLPGANPLDFTNVDGDEPARVDLLNRRSLAAGIAAQLAAWSEREMKDTGGVDNHVMPLLLDAPWGAGKSTVLGFLQERLTTRMNWLVADRPFDAWRESQVGAAWWSLLNHARTTIAADKRAVPRIWFGLRGFFNRLRYAVRGSLITVVLVAAIALFAGLYATDRGWFGADPASTATTTTSTTATTSPTATPTASTTPPAPATTTTAPGSTDTTPAAGGNNPGIDGVLDDLGGLADSLTKILSLVALLAVGWFGVVRIGLWYTPLGARLQQRTSENPMAAVMSHVQWLRRQTRKPMAIVIDDLDRCRSEYVVSVLEALQTLVRQPVERVRPRWWRRDRIDKPALQPLVFVVAADSAWLRSAIQQHYDKFATDVARPGRSLGWLFLDKLFPIRVSLIDPESGALHRFTMRALGMPDGSAASVRGPETAVPRTGDTSPSGAPRQTLRSAELGTAETEAAQSIEQEEELRIRRSEARVRAAKTMRQKEELVRLATSDDERSRLQVAAAETSVTTQTLGEASYLLAEYVPEIARIANPRTIYQFRNNYILNRISAGGFPDAETIIRWTLVEVQWPDLADSLRRDPRLLESIRLGTVDKANPLYRVAMNADVRNATSGLTPDGVRALLRLADNSGSLDVAIMETETDSQPDHRPT